MTDSDIGFLLELTAIPTAAGREGRVVSFIKDWVDRRDDLTLDTDASGNLTISIREPSDPGSPVYFTAHLDHPAFVVERVIAPSALELAFRGGVMDDYFPGARVEVITNDDKRLPGTIAEQTDPTTESPYKHYLCELDEPAEDITTSDIARWLLPEPSVENGIICTSTTPRPGRRWPRRWGASIWTPPPSEPKASIRQTFESSSHAPRKSASSERSRSCTTAQSRRMPRSSRSRTAARSQRRRSVAAQSCASAIDSRSSALD